MVEKFYKVVEQNIDKLEDRICHLICDNDLCPLKEIGCNKCLSHIANEIYKNNTLLKIEALGENDFKD